VEVPVMNSRIFASIRKDIKVLATTWQSYGLTMLFYISVMAVAVFLFEGSDEGIDEAAFLSAQPLVEIVLYLVVPFVSAMLILQPITQQLFHRERVKKNFETVLTTPLSKEELWFSKVLNSSFFGFISFLITMAIVLLVAKLYFPNVWFVITSLGFLPFANAAFLTFLFMLQVASVAGWLFLIVKNSQNVNKAPLAINFTFMISFGYVFRKIPTFPLLYLDIAVVVLTAVVMFTIFKILSNTKLEKIILND
jgi:ABC-type Na+ efflux pump permease subunit